MVDAEDIADFTVTEVCAELDSDIAEVGATIINQVGDELSINVELDIGSLSSRVCKAWGLRTEAPIMITMRDISATMYYSAGKLPVVKIWQTAEDGSIAQVGVIPQLQFILLNYLRKEWKAHNDADTRTLVSMGFRQNMAHTALIQTNGNLGNAIEVLTNTAGTGLLAQIVSYLKARLRTLHEFCPLCDERHVYSTPMLKPAICRRELCAFAFSKLGLMQDSVDGYANQTEVIDLLVAMFRAATNSQRSEQVMCPFPLIYDPKNPDVPVISEYGRDLELTKAALNGIQLKHMIEISKHSNNAHPLSYPLMQWIIGSNRSHLVKLSDDKMLQCIHTSYQYLLLSAPPEVEEQFAKQKAQHGSVWAFHGSRTENWHCILRSGLKNMSGTKGMLHGAAYGPGVYCSPQLATSMGYSLMYNIQAPRTNVLTTPQSKNSTGESYLDDSGFVCVAICEIIKGAEKRHNQQVWTIVDDTKIVTRFFIVYPASSASKQQGSVDTTSKEFLKQIEFVTAQ